MSDLMRVLPDIKLKFHIDYPSFEECYVSGYQAALETFREEDNPYAENTNEHRYWQDGWWDAYYNEEPLFSITQPDREELTTIQTHPWTYPLLKITGFLGVTALVGYQLLDLVA